MLRFVLTLYYAKLSAVHGNVLSFSYTILVEHRKRVVDSHRSNLIAPFSFEQNCVDVLFSVIAEELFFPNNAVLDLGCIRHTRTETQVRQFMNIFFKLNNAEAEKTGHTYIHTYILFLLSNLS